MIDDPTNIIQSIFEKLKGMEIKFEAVTELELPHEFEYDDALTSFLFPNAFQNHAE